MIKPIRCLLVLSTIFSLKANASGTSIGNGGDPLFYFLESTRFALRQTLGFLSTDRAGGDHICDSLQNLTPTQRTDCTSFAQQIIAQVLDLNAPQNPTPFVLRDDPLMVVGPDGKPMPVAARTDLGPNGPVEFHRPSNQFLGPSQILLLMAHEFGHKVQFGGTNIQDNPPIMSFPNGRLLLDSFGGAVSYWALKKGFIGSNYGLRDLFDCEVSSNGGKLRVRVSTPRKFKGDNFDAYEITIGYAPTDPSIEVPELSGDTLQLRLHVTESRSCLEASAGRKSELEVIRLFAGEPKTEIVSYSDFPGFNPVCNQSKQSLTIDAAGFHFSCLYIGSEGVTSTRVSLGQPKARQILR